LDKSLVRKSDGKDFLRGKARTDHANAGILTKIIPADGCRNAVLPRQISLGEDQYRSEHSQIHTIAILITQPLVELRHQKRGFRPVPQVNNA